MIKKILLKKMLTLAALILMCIMVVSPAVEGGSSTPDNSSDIKIKSIPKTTHEQGFDFRRNAKNYYDFIGTVDDVQENGIVVDDSYMKFAAKAIVSASRGARVGIRLNDAGEVLLCEPFRKTSGK